MHARHSLLPLHFCTLNARFILAHSLVAHLHPLAPRRRHRVHEALRVPPLPRSDELLRGRRPDTALALARGEEPIKSGASSDACDRAELQPLAVS